MGIIDTQNTDLFAKSTMLLVQCKNANYHSPKVPDEP